MIHTINYLIIISLMIILILLPTNTVIGNLLNNNTHQNTFYSKSSKTIIFDKDGMIEYQLTSKNITFIPKKNFFYLEKLSLIHFDNKQRPNWIIYANQAKLINNQIIFLLGNVKFQFLKKQSNLKCITTSSAKLNLKTKDIDSNTQIMLYGKKFFSISNGFHSNLYTKNTKMINRVHTYYEMP